MLHSSIHPNKSEDPLQGLLKYVHEQIQKNVSHSFMTTASSSSSSNNHNDLTAQISDELRGSVENASQIQLKIQFSQSLLEIVSKITDVKNRWKREQEENKDKAAKMISLIQALKQTLAEQKQEIHLLQQEKEQQHLRFLQEKEVLEKLLSVSSREISTQTTDSYVSWSEERRRTELLVQQMRGYMVKSYEENRSLRHELKQSLLLLQAQQEMLSLDESMKDDRRKRTKQEEKDEYENEDEELEEEEEEMKVFNKVSDTDHAEIRLTSGTAYKVGIAERYSRNIQEEEEVEEEEEDELEQDVKEDDYDVKRTSLDYTEEEEVEEEEEEEEKMNTSLDSVEISSLQRYYQYNLSPPQSTTVLS